MDGMLVGRATMLEALLADCRRRQSVLLAGTAGVGKSRLLREVVDRLAPKGWWVERFVATESTRDIAFGALISLQPRDAGGDRAEVLAAMRAALIARAGTRPLVVAVDDAHHLDESSLACLADLVHRDDAVVLLTVRTDDDVPASLTSLWSSGALDRVAVDPLTEDATVELATELLGGPVDPGLAGALVAATRGNPLLVRELLLDSQACSAIACEQGTWCQRGPFDPGPRLRELVSARVNRLEPDERAVLEVVAVGEPLACTVLVGDEEQLLDDLERRGLVRLDAGAGGLSVRCDHPLIGETIRAALASRRRMEVVADLARRLVDMGCPRPGDALRAAGWWRASGGALPPDLATSAAQEALAALDLDVAVDLAQDALREGARCDALVTLGSARRLQGRPQEADTLLARAIELAPDEILLTRATKLRSQVLVQQLGQTEEAIALLDDVAGRMQDATLVLELRQFAFYFSGMFGRFRDVVRISGEILSLDRADAETRWLALENGLYAKVMLGRVHDVDASVQAYIDGAVSRGGNAEIVDLGWALRTGVLSQRGELIDGERIVGRHIGERRAEGRSWCTSATIFAQLLLLRGSVDVFGVLDDTLHELDRVDPFGVLPIALGLSARAHAQALRVGDAIRALELVPEDHSDLRNGSFVGRGRAAVLAASGNVERAAEVAVESGMQALESSHVAFGIVALHDAARYGAADVVADVMDEAVVDHGVRLLRAMADDAVARRDRDGKAVAGAGEAFAEMGAPILAADALAHAAGLLAADSAVARRSATWSALLARDAAPFAVPEVTGVVDLLSSRELDVARLAVGGARNREIAERLFVSPRTVENHLHRVYQKLEVAGRAELADVLCAPRSDP